MALVLAWMLAAWAPAVPAAPRPVEVAMARALAEEGLSGVVWAEVVPDREPLLGAAGAKHADAPMTPDTRVHVGSVAKVVLALGVLRLASEGRLSLDVPVSQVLPGIRFDNPWETVEPVRVRHLLAHTAGLENLRLRQFFSLEARPDAPLAEVFARDPSLLRIQSRPGSRFGYSNMGYTLLGMVVEATTGERYERYLDAHLLRPLGMADSTFAYTTQSGPAADPRLAMGHFEQGVAQAAVPLHLRPAAQFATTAADMATFARFLMSDGAVHGEPFIAPTLMAALTVPSSTEASASGLPLGHGLALAGRDRHGVVGGCHPGNTVGFMAMLCLFPQERKAFFVAINSDSEGADYERFHALLVSALELAPSAPQAAGGIAGDIGDWRGFYVPHPVQMRPLAWVDRIVNVLHVRPHGSQLQLASLQAGVQRLEPVAGRLFRAPGRTLASHVLLVSADGERVISTGTRSHVRVAAPGLLLLWGSLLAGLAGLAYVLVVGSARAARAKLPPSDPLFLPLLAGVALLLPIPFFLSQSLLALGDRTVASILLAVTTGALPLAIGAGLARCLCRRRRARQAGLDGLMLLAALQCVLVLAAWGLVPLRLWH